MTAEAAPAGAQGAAQLSLVGLSQGDPASPRTGSGVARFLFQALARRHRMVERVDVDLHGVQRAVVAARTFHPSRTAWRGRYYWCRNVALEARSRNAERAVARIEQPADLAIQVFGLFQTRGMPYAIYTDNTMEVSRRCWPGWVPSEEKTALAWERRVFGEARHVFTMGRLAAQSVVEDYGVPEERVTVVGGGVNFDELPTVERRGSEPIVLFVGRFWRRKGGDVLVEAFRRVRERLPEARLVVVGTQEPAAEPGVEVIGAVEDRQQLAELYARAALFCMPSRFEPYGLVLCEAMAFGLPCVSTDVGAMAEVVVDGETGLIAPPEDPDALAAALLALLEDRERAERMGAAGRRRVEDYLNWDAVAERMEPGLRQAAAG